MGYDTPSFMPHVTVPGMWLSRSGRPCSWAVLHGRGWVFTASEQRLFCHTQESSLPPFGVGVCTSLTADKPGAVASIPEGAGLNPPAKVFFPNQT